jgi:hypothetical protein
MLHATNHKLELSSLRMHTPRTASAVRGVCNSRRVFVDNLYLIVYYISMLSCPHEQKAYRVWLIGVANKAVFAALMGFTK